MIRVASLCSVGVLVVTGSLIAQTAVSTPSARLKHAELKIEHLAGQLESASRQLETEKDVADETISTLNNVLLAIPILITAFGLLGFAEFRRIITSRAREQVEAVLAKDLEALVQKKLGEKLAYWDDRFAALLKRVERLLPPQ